ncbi:MAG: hypothetical protein IK103_08835 [Bacteroidales bacterium]|nr:hypothetical protein [Bacteroidales bacterium]
MTGFSRSVSFSTSHLKYISGITVIVKQYLDFIKNADSGIYLSDQGIIQDLISISYRKEIRELSSLRAVFKSLEKKNLSFLRVDCNLAVDKTLERIGTRLDGGSRLDGMDWDLAKKILNIQSGNFDVVRNTCSEFALGNHLSLDMEDSAEENANKLLASLQL